MGQLAASLLNISVARFNADDLPGCVLHAWAARRLGGEQVTAQLIPAIRSQLMGRIESAQGRGESPLALQLDGLFAVFDPESRLRLGAAVAAQRAAARCLDAERALLRGRPESAGGLVLAALALDPENPIALRRLSETAQAFSARCKNHSEAAPGLEEIVALSLAVALGARERLRELADLLYGLADFESVATLCRWIEEDASVGFTPRFEALQLRFRAGYRLLGDDQAAAEARAIPDLRAWLAALGPSSGLEEAALRTRVGFCFGAGGHRQTLADLRALRRFTPEDPWVAHNLCILLPNVLYPDLSACAEVVARRSSDAYEDLRERYRLMTVMGAVPQTLALAERLTAHHPEYSVIAALHAMATDLDHKPTHVFGRAPVGRRLLYANLACWGESYVDLMERAAIASLLAPGNLPALAEKVDLVVELFTMPEDAQRLRDSPSLERLARHCEIRIHCFPEILSGRNKAFGYATYGYALHATALRAERDGADITFLMPDVIYGDGGYGLIAEKATSAPRAIFVDGLNTYATPMLARMEPYRRDEALVVPPQDLIDASMQCLAKRTLHSLYPPGDGRTCVEPTRVIFPIEGGLCIHAFMMQPVYVSHAALAPILMKNFGTQDGLMSEHILNNVGDDEIEVLSASDFCCAEVCDGEGALRPMADIDLVSGVRRFFNDFALGRNRLRLFNRPVYFPTRSPPDLPLVSVEEADARLREMREMFATDPLMVDIAEEQERLGMMFYRR